MLPQPEFFRSHAKQVHVSDMLYWDGDRVDTLKNAAIPPAWTMDKRDVMARFDAESRREFVWRVPQAQVEEMLQFPEKELRMPCRYWGGCLWRLYLGVSTCSSAQNVSGEFPCPPAMKATCSVIRYLPQTNPVTVVKRSDYFVMGTPWGGTMVKAIDTEQLEKLLEGCLVIRAHIEWIQ